MKILIAVGLAVALAAVLALVLRPATPEPLRSSAAGSSAAVPVGLPSAPPVAVVELFTSEGCSSCPPADQLLVDLAERGDAGLLVLAFHVDYWNRLGWRDPFSDAAYSQRQRAYARSFASGRVYTPQMIVNGRREFVGSRRREAEAAVRQALEQPASAGITLRPSMIGDVVSVEYAVDGAPSGAVLHLALVQRRAEQAIPRGENKGRTLRHANVVRAFETVLADAGTQTLTLPRGLQPNEAAIIAYVQHPETMHIAGAAQAALHDAVN